MVSQQLASMSTKSLGDQRALFMELNCLEDKDVRFSRLGRNDTLATTSGV